MIDGTHVIAVVPIDKSIPYFGRKGYPTQNVIAAYDFDMLFTFVLPGWEGSTHLFCLDGKVQHTTPPFFLILFVNKVTTFQTHH